MNKQNIRLSGRQAAWLGLALALSAVLLFIGGSSTQAQAGATTPKTSVSALSPNAITCPAGQCFTDVPPANGFYTNVNNLYMDGIIGGYACGGTGEPCDADNRPYYRPGNNVSRQQMSKFVDNGRRNIADAVGNTLYISTTAYIAVDAETNSGGYGVYTRCWTPGSNCYAVYGGAVAGTYAGVFSGGTGLFAAGGDDNYPAIKATTSAATSYALDASSDNYRSALVANSNTSWYGLYVDANGSTVGSFVNGNAYVQGDLTVTGSKTGYVVDVMQSADTATLEPGDVVTIVGNSPAVLGDIPVVTIKKASSAYDTGVVGVVDASLYVPNAQTRATYQAEQQAQKDALAQRQLGQAQAAAAGTKFDPGTVAIPAATISDAQGNVHTDVASKEITTNTYANVVTLGSYKGVKVDASFGAIHAGDLLVASTHAGYAMKATDKTQTSGSVIGKALGSLETGTGLVPVMVTLK